MPPTTPMVTHLDNTLLNAHLSYTQFEQAIKQFESQTRRHQPWSLVEYQVRKGVPAQFYLSRTDIVVDYPSSNASTEAINGSHSDHVPEINGDGDILVENEDSALEEIEDDAEAYQNHAFGEVLSASYHIVYSPTYQVPVLYFNAYRSNGVTISIDEIFTRLVPEAWRTAVRNAGLSGGVSQQDHPILSTPFYYLHPCETGALMDTLLKGQQGQLAHDGSLTLSTYIRVWLSMTGQAIGLSLPPEVFLDNLDL